MTDYERGYRAGIEAAAKILDAEARPFAMRGGSHYLIITQAAVAIRALAAAPDASPESRTGGACERCGGIGNVYTFSPGGMTTGISSCPACGGTGDARKGEP